jgi:hypothetical protein
MAMRAWYDILALDRSMPQDAQGIRESAAQVSTKRTALRSDSELSV